LSLPSRITQVELAQPSPDTALRLCFIADSRSLHTARWLRFFSERGHSVALVSSHPPQYGLQVDSYYALSTRSRAPATRIVKNVLEVRKAIRDFKPDALHAHYINESGWLGALSGFHPFVLTAWGSDIYQAPFQSRLASVLSPWAVRRADYVTADSHDQVERLRAMGAGIDSSVMVTWGVDLAKFTGRTGSVWREKHGIDGRRFVVLSPREWIPNSNIEMIVRAFTLARQGRPAMLLALKVFRRGTSAETQAKMAALIQSLGISDSTLVIDEEPEEILPEMYAAADVTVSVCSSDGTPVSVLEAMASESAPIVSRLPSLGDWIEEGRSGFLAPPEDCELLARRMGQLADDAALRRSIGQSARMVIEAKGDREVNLGRVEHEYRGLALSVLKRGAPLVSNRPVTAVSDAAYDAGGASDPVYNGDPRN
jgi:glycosyltransferase involved in cell wall biosynthesis